MDAFAFGGRMKSRDFVLLALLGGAAYFLLRKDAAGYSLADRLISGLPLPRAGDEQHWEPALAAPSSNTNRAGQIIGASTAIAGVAIPLIGGGSAAAAGAGGTAAAGAGAGIGVGAIAAAAGIAAGAAILAWGIVSKGWFRGGEEALKVNPGRDAFWNDCKEKTGVTDPYKPAGFIRLGEQVRMPGYEIDRMIRRIDSADHMDEFEAAMNDVRTTFAAYASANTSAVPPAWRQQQLAGAFVFAGGATPQTIIDEARRLGSNYTDLVAAYSRGGWV